MIQLPQLLDANPSLDYLEKKGSQLLISASCSLEAIRFERISVRNQGGLKELLETSFKSWPKHKGS